MVINADDPTVVDSFTVYTEGRLQGRMPAPLNWPVDPDNLDAGDASLMVQEDTANAKIWRNDFASTWTHVGTVTRPDSTPARGVERDRGCPSLAGRRLVGARCPIARQSCSSNPNNHADHQFLTGPMARPAGRNYQLRREDGQLLLLYLPGS